MHLALADTRWGWMRWGIMRLVSWNVNGIRAAMGKGFQSWVEEAAPDILCLQEVKAHQDQVELEWAERLGYQIFWNPAEKKGYSGTAILTKETPGNVTLGMDIPHHDGEGRVTAAEYPDFHLVTVYTPNSQRGLLRLDYRQQWDQDFLSHVNSLAAEKPVIFCGDLNVAHREIDLANPKSNRKNAGFTDEERAGFDNILNAGFVDAFRAFEEGPGHYSWWTWRANARERNIGWRIDYFCVSEPFMNRVKSSSILSDIHGSDHCPVQLELA